MKTLVGWALARAGDNHKLLIVLTKDKKGELHAKNDIVESDDTEYNETEAIEYAMEAGETMPLGVARSWIDAVGDWTGNRPDDQDLL